MMELKEGYEIGYFLTTGKKKAIDLFSEQYEIPIDQIHVRQDGSGIWCRPKTEGELKAQLPPMEQLPQRQEVRE